MSEWQDISKTIIVDAETFLSFFFFRIILAMTITVWGLGSIYIER